MRNQPIVQTQAIRTDRRLDLLLKKQEGEHQHLISAHNKEMQALRDELRLAIEKAESLSQRNESDLKDFKTYAVCQMGILKVKIEASEAVIASQQKTIETLHGQLQDFLQTVSSKEDIEKFKKTMEGKISDSTKDNLISFQECQSACKALFTSLMDEFAKLRMDTSTAMVEAISKMEGNYNQAALDKEGIEREMIRYKKAAFYVEKKIENIYTLIERINKRGAA